MLNKNEAKVCDVSLKGKLIVGWSLTWIIHLLNQNEVKVYDDSPKEKLIIKVEFDENSSPIDKGDGDIDSHATTTRIILFGF